MKDFKLKDNSFEIVKEDVSKLLSKFLEDGIITSENSKENNMETETLGTSQECQAEQPGNPLILVSKKVTDPIEMIPVESTNIKAIGYSSTLQVLAVTFKTATYFYNGILPSFYKRFLESESKGKFFNSHKGGLDDYKGVHTKEVKKVDL